MCIQFAIGSFDESPTLLNDLILAARRNFTSVGGFWYSTGLFNLVVAQTLLSSFEFNFIVLVL